MNEFKFDCSTCGQHILVAHEWIGREIDCPSCKTRLIIPPPQKARKKNMLSKPPAAEKQLEPQSGSIPLGSPRGASSQPVIQPPTTAPALKIQGVDKSAEPGLQARTEPASAAPEKPQQLRVAVLTPAIKLEIVHAVRERIADESAWLPNKVNGEPAYAAKVSDGKIMLVEVTNSEKLQLKGRIAPEDVAAALYHELVEVNRRLDQLEGRGTPGDAAGSAGEPKPSPGPPQPGTTPGS